jgi:hypothetical protein
MSRDELKAGMKVLVEAVVSDPTYWHGGVIVNVGRLMANVKRKEVHPFPGVQEWRPIESAPKDGTPVLTLRHGTLQGVAEWNQGIWRMVHGPDIVGVTHWLPLPPPPSSAEQGEG